MPGRPRLSRRSRPRPGLAAVVLLALVAAACGGDRGSEEGAPDGGGGSSSTAAPGATAPCGPVAEEPLHPNLGHLVAGTPEPSYLTDPPTSGPHVAGGVPTGVLGEPLAGSQQVALLEHGHVLLQHRDLPPADVARLEALAGGQVTVAPNPGLPDRVVATAWTVKQVCRAVDEDALRQFVTAHVGRGPGEG